MTEGPPAAVLGAFRAGGPAVLLEGGQGEAFRAGDLVLKPTDDLAETEWVSALLHELSVGGVRTAQPVRTADGSWVVDGWAATRWLPGVASPEDRWVEVLDVCDRVHASLARTSRPPFLDARHHRWARSDRMTWGEEPLAREVLAEASIAGLVGLLRPVDLPHQLVHGDLSGNVLLHPHLEPAVIDWSLYWRPAGYARATVVVDALLWYAAADDLTVAEAERVWGGQLLLRALLFRLIVERLAELELRDRDGYPDQYLRVVGLVARLADR